MALQAGIPEASQDQEMATLSVTKPCSGLAMSGTNCEPRQESKHLDSASCQGRTTFWPLLGEIALEGCGSASLTSSI